MEATPSRPQQKSLSHTPHEAHPPPQPVKPSTQIHPADNRNASKPYVRLSIDVTPETRRALKLVALEQDSNVSEVVRGLISKLI